MGGCFTICFQSVIYWNRKDVTTTKSVIYYWYDHLLLRETGEAEIVTKAIEQHDFYTFKKIFDKYPATKNCVYFPTTAMVFDDDKDDFVDEIDITTPDGFAKIDASEYECG